MHYLRDLLLQAVDELGGLVFFPLYISQFLLPNARKLATLQEVFLDDVDKFYACRRGHQVLAFPPDVMPLEERLYNGSAARGAAYAILLESGPQLFVFHELSRRFHRAQQRGLGIILGRLGPLLCQSGLMGSALPLLECGQRALLLRFPVVRFQPALLFGIDRPPTRIYYLLPRNLELHFLHLSRHGGGGELAIGIEHADEAARYQIVHIRFHISKPSRNHARGNDSVVVCHLRGIKHLLALGQLLPPACQRLHQGQISLLGTYAGLAHAIEYLGALGIDVIGKVLRVHTGISGELLLIETLDKT